MPGAPEKGARLVFCHKSGNQILTDLRGEDGVSLCDCCNVVRRRFLTTLPTISTKKVVRQEEGDDLMRGVLQEDSDK